MRQRFTRRLLVLLCLTCLAGASAAVAGTFTVTLTNGTSFESRYRPVEVDWDDAVVLIHTDRGNPIALLRDEIADVTSSVEETGFGYQVDTSTLFVGWKPTDEPEEGQEGEGGQQQGAAAFPDEPPSFTVEQFINPPTVGGIIGGLPADDTDF